MLKRVKRFLTDRHALDAAAGIFGASAYEVTGSVVDDARAAELLAEDKARALAAFCLKAEGVLAEDEAQYGGLEYVDTPMEPAELRQLLMLAATSGIKRAALDPAQSALVGSHFLSCFSNLDLYQVVNAGELVSLDDLQNMAEEDPAILATAHQAFDVAVEELHLIRYGEQA